MKKKQFETLLYSVVGIAAMFLILVAANIVFNVAKTRVDLTAEKLYTHVTHVSVPSFQGLQTKVVKEED